MTTMADLVTDTRRMAYGSMADQLNFLSAVAPANATELYMSLELVGITPGMVLSSGLNEYYVTNVSATENKVTVYPSYNGSRSDSLPIGSPVMIRPRVTDFQLFQNLNSEIKQLSAPSNGLYKVGSWTSNVDVTWQTYDVPVAAQGMISLLRVRVRWPATPDIWSDMPDYTFDYQQDKQIIKLRRNIPASSELLFVYKDSFHPAADLTDDIVADCGLAETMLDIPPLGATARLLRTTEARRVQIHNQGDSRKAEEVQMYGNSSIAKEMDRAYQQRVNDEFVRLVNNHPINMGI